MGYTNTQALKLVSQAVAQAHGDVDKTIKLLEASKDVSADAARRMVQYRLQHESCSNPNHIEVRDGEIYIGMRDQMQARAMDERGGREAAPAPSARQTQPASHREVAAAADQSTPAPQRESQQDSRQPSSASRQEPGRSPDRQQTQHSPQGRVQQGQSKEQATRRPDQREGLKEEATPKREAPDQRARAESGPQAARSGNVEQSELRQRVEAARSGPVAGRDSSARKTPETFKFMTEDVRAIYVKAHEDGRDYLLWDEWKAFFDAAKARGIVTDEDLDLVRSGKYTPIRKGFLALAPGDVGSSIRHSILTTASDIKDAMERDLSPQQFAEEGRAREQDDLMRERKIEMKGRGHEMLQSL